MHFPVRRCQCGRIIKISNGKRCSTCTDSYRQVKAKIRKRKWILTEEQVDELVLEETERFREKVARKQFVFGSKVEIK